MLGLCCCTYCYRLFIFYLKSRSYEISLVVWTPPPSGPPIIYGNFPVVPLMCPQRNVTSPCNSPPLDPTHLSVLSGAKL